MKKKVAFFTLGCKVNQYETNKMEMDFYNAGYEIVKNEETADIYVINTCAVTNIAEKKSRQMLRKAKRINPDAIIIVCGCYAQIAKEEIKKIKEVDMVLDNKEKVEIINKINTADKNKTNFDIKRDKLNILPDEKNRAIIKVQDGCNMFCSYCIIPYARGRIKSREIQDIVKEVVKIAQNGIKEVVITGIHIASYGKDFENEKIGLIDLLEKLNSINGIERIRLGSLEPTIITPEFLNRLTKLNKICNHFHLSLQSGCDATLKRMNRKYTTKEFDYIVKLLRGAYSDVNLTTDIIVGFPNETEEEFNITYNFLKDIKFYKMHIFKYSKRKGTVAEKMPNQISPEVKEERSSKLIELSNNNEIEYNKKYIGKTLNVLFEEKDGKYFKGHTSNYMLVKVEEDNKNSNCKIINEILNVDIIGLDGIELIGKFS